MITSTGLRGKVERLLKGDVRQTDLHNIFSQMRDETGGNGLVGEIANFPAYPVRSQGAIWQNINNATSCLRLRVSMNFLSDQVIYLVIVSSGHSATEFSSRSHQKN